MKHQPPCIMNSTLNSISERIHWQTALFLCGITLFAVEHLYAADQCSAGSSSGYYIQYETSSAYLTKCRYPELAHQDPPRVHMYHQQVTTENYSYSVAGSITTTQTFLTNTSCGGGGNASISYGPGTLSTSQSETRVSTFTQYAPGPS